MSISVVQKGDNVRIATTFTDVSGVAVDPTTVELKVKDPSGNVDTYLYPASPTEVERTAEGSYRKDIEADESGDWHYSWVSTGTGQAAEAGQFAVEPSQF